LLPIKIGQAEGFLIRLRFNGQKKRGGKREEKLQVKRNTKKKKKRTTVYFRTSESLHQLCDAATRRGGKKKKPRGSPYSFPKEGGGTRRGDQLRGNWEVLLLAMPSGRTARLTRNMKFYLQRMWLKRPLRTKKVETFSGG